MIIPAPQLVALISLLLISLAECADFRLGLKGKAVGKKSHASSKSTPQTPIGRMGLLYLSKLQKILIEMNYGGTKASAINEYLCRTLPDARDDLRANEEQLIQVGKYVLYAGNKRTQVVYGDSATGSDKLKYHFSLFYDLIRLARENRLCGQEGVSALIGASEMAGLNYLDLKTKAIGKDPNLGFEFQPPIVELKCNSRLKLITDHYDEQRRQTCGSNWAEGVLSTLDKMDRVQANRQVGILNSGLLELSLQQVEPHGGGGDAFNLYNCVALSWQDVRLPRQEVGKHLVSGLTSLIESENVANEYKLLFEYKNSAQRATDVEIANMYELDFLQLFAKLRKKYLTNTCEYFTEQLKEPLNEFKLYKSFFKQDDRSLKLNEIDRFKLKFKSAYDELRLLKSLAMFKLCKDVILPKVPQISMAMLSELGYDLAASRLTSEQLKKALQ